MTDAKNIHFSAISIDLNPPPILLKKLKKKHSFFSISVGFSYAYYLLGAMCICFAPSMILMKNPKPLSRDDNNNNQVSK